MDFLRKFFNPFKKNKKHTYQDLSKESRQITVRPPSELLLYSRDIAGLQLQKHMNILNNCGWIRSEYVYPAFDNMNFIYKNVVFSILIDIRDKDGKSFLPDIYVKRQLIAAKEYNLIPCKFPITVDNPYNPDMKTAEALCKGWNLFHTSTNELVIPEHLATVEKIKMSEWEKRNFAINFVRKYLFAKKLKVLSYQDTMEVDPQLWFEDENGKKCWVVIRCAIAPEKDIPEPKKLSEIIRRCFTYEGYFTCIVLKPISEDNILYRGGSVRIDFEGLEKVHSVL